MIIGAALLLCAGILGWAAFRYRRRSTREGAANQVAHILRQYAHMRGFGTQVLEGEETVNGNRMEPVLVGPFGLLMVRVIPEGSIVYGEPRASHWRMRIDQDMVEFPNPLLEMEQKMETLRVQWSKWGVYGVPMEPLVVFAHPGKIELFLPGVGQAVTVRELHRALRDNKRLQKDAGMEVPKLTELLKAGGPSN